MFLFNAHLCSVKHRASINLGVGDVKENTDIHTLLE